MGKRASRLTDMDTGHGKHPPTPVITGSPGVTINGLPAARVGDKLAPHRHARAIAAGSGTVFIDGRPAARITDAIDCGGVLIQGSGDVLIGD